MSSDKLAKTYKVNIAFVDGETPTASKLNAWSLQINNALTTIEKALGDVWDESYPYFDTSDKLTQAFEQVDGDDISDEKKLEIANLARLIGPSSALNPIHLSGLTASERVVSQTLGINRTQWSLRYAPIDETTITFDESPAVTFATRVLSAASLLNAGEYYVDGSSGEIYAVTPTTAVVVATYTVEDSYDAFASYRGASFNVIPAPDQTTKCVATGPDGEGKYTITLPVLTDQDTEDTRTTTVITDRSLNYSVQLKLPQVLDHLTAGDTIPDGYLFVRDDTTNQLYRSATYYYENTTSLKVGGVTIDTANGFTVITVGANLTQSVQDLQLKLFRLRRGLDTRTVIGPTGLGGAAGTYNNSLSGAEAYGPSEAPNNYFPQYLNRDGWFGSTYDDGNINDSNGMRGDLVMLSTVRSGGSRNNLTADSTAIRFGHATNGPLMRLVNGVTDYFEIDGNGVDVHITSGDLEVDSDDLIVQTGISYLNGGFRTGVPLGVNNGPYKILEVTDTFVRDGATNDAVITLSAEVALELLGKTIVQLIVNLSPLDTEIMTTSGSLTTRAFYAACDRVSPTGIALNELGLAYDNILPNNIYALIVYKD